MSRSTAYLFKKRNGTKMLVMYGPLHEIKSIVIVSKIMYFILISMLNLWKFYFDRRILTSYLGQEILLYFCNNKFKLILSLIINDNFKLYLKMTIMVFVHTNVKIFHKISLFNKFMYFCKKNINSIKALILSICIRKEI